MVEMVKLLIENSANVNAKMKDGFTALDLAKGRCLDEISNILLEAGAKSSSRKWNKPLWKPHIPHMGRGRGRGRGLV